MKFKYDYNMIPSSTLKITAGLESLNHNTPSYFELSELAYDIRSSIIDFNFTAFGTEAEESSSNSNDPWYKKMWKFIKDLFLKIIGFIKSGFKWIKKKIFGEKEEIKKQSEETKELVEALSKAIKENEELKKKYESNTMEYMNGVTEVINKILNDYKKVTQDKSQEDISKIVKEMINFVKNEIKEFKFKMWILNDDVSSRVTNMTKKYIGRELDHVASVKKPIHSIATIDLTIKLLIDTFFGNTSTIDELSNKVGIGYDRGIERLEEDNFEKLDDLVSLNKAISNKCKSLLSSNTDTLLKESSFVIHFDDNGDYDKTEIEKYEKETANTEYVIDKLVAFFDNLDSNIKRAEEAVRISEEYTTVKVEIEGGQDAVNAHKAKLTKLKECLMHISESSTIIMKLFNKTFINRLRKTEDTIVSAYGYIY